MNNVACIVNFTCKVCDGIGESKGGGDTFPGAGHVLPEQQLGEPLFHQIHFCIPIRQPRQNLCNYEPTATVSTQHMETIKPEGGSRTTFFGRSCRPGAALDQWLLDSTRFRIGGSGATMASSPSSMLPLPLVLHCEDKDDDDRSDREEDEKDDEKDRLDAMTRRLGRNLSRLCPRPRNRRTITSSGSSQAPDYVRTRAWA